MTGHYRVSSIVTVTMLLLSVPALRAALVPAYVKVFTLTDLGLLGPLLMLLAALTTLSLKRLHFLLRRGRKASS